MKALSISIDSREPDQIKNLTFGSVPVTPSRLAVGSLLMLGEDGNIVLVERKNPQEFFTALHSQQLFGKLAEMRTVTPFSYLALTGRMYPAADGTINVNIDRSIDSPPSTWKWASLEGALLSIQEIGVHVALIGSEENYGRFIERLASRHRGPQRIAPAREALPVPDNELVLTAFPGIGPERAASLIAHCGSPAWAISYLVDPAYHGAEAPGIGKETKRRTRAALGLEDWQTLAVFHKDQPAMPLEPFVSESVAVPA